MTKQETMKILSVISATYPTFKPSDPKATAEVWAEMFKEFEYSDVSNALREYIASDTSGFAPVIGQLTTRIANRTNNYLEPTEAWSLVYKAICNGTYHSVEEFNKLPPEVQKAIGSPDNIREMASMDNDAMSVEQSHFINAYRSVIARSKQNDALPPSMRIGVAEKQLIESHPTMAIEEKRNTIPMPDGLMDRLSEVEE